MKFKRFISAVLSLMMISSMITTAAAAEKTDKASTSDTSPIIGDLDYDGRITSADSLFVLRASVGLEKLTEEKQKLADVDIDGNISSADALEILRYSVGLPVTSEVGNSLYENSEISDFKADKNTIPVGVESTITFTVKIADKNLKPNLIYKCDLDNAGVINFVNFNDTGFYGDKKADDGIYTCEFNVTPREAVVYQFYVDCRTARSANITVRAVDSGNAGSDKDSTDIFSSTDVDSDSTDVHSDTDIVLSNFTSDEEYFSCDKDSSITFTAEASGKSDSVGLYKNDWVLVIADRQINLQILF